MQNISFRLSAEVFRGINLREMLTVRLGTGERYLVEIRKVNFLDNGDVTIEGIGDPLDEPEED